MLWTIILIFFSLSQPLLAIEVIPPYCKQAPEIEQDCHCSTTQDPPTYKILEKNINKILSPAKNFQEDLMAYALANLIEQQFHLNIMYPQSTTKLIPPACNQIFAENKLLRKLNKLLTTKIQQIPPQQSLYQKTKFETRIDRDFKKIRPVWKKISDLKSRKQDLNVSIGLLRNKKHLLSKTILFIGDKQQTIRQIDKKIDHYRHQVEEIEHQLQQQLPIISTNPLLLNTTPVETKKSFYGVSPSPLFQSLEKGNKNFTPAIKQHRDELKAGMEQICKTQGEDLHLQPALVQDYFFSQFKQAKHQGLDPIATIQSLQFQHCTRLKEYPPPKDHRLYYSLATGGILLTSLALIPFTGGGSLATALLWTAGVGSTAVGLSETYNSYNKFIQTQSLYNVQLSSIENLSEDYLEFRNNSIMSTIDVTLLGLDAYKLYRVPQRVISKELSTATKIPKRKYVKTFADFKKHTQLHIKRVEKIGLYIYKKFPKEFPHIDRKLAQDFLKIHDQGKVNYSLWAKQKKKPIIKEIYKYYNVPKTQISPQAAEKLTKAVNELNTMDQNVAYHFFSEHNLLTADQQLSPAAKELLKLEHLADLVDRGKNIVSPEEFAKAQMTPASNWFNNTREIIMSKEAEKNYDAIIKGLDFTSNHINP